VFSGSMRLPLFRSTGMALCTCLPKYNLNTYLGRCAHGCLYCYATKFPSFTGPVRPRTALLDTIEGMARGTKEKLPVMISDCTDPYQPLEEENRITRRCAQVLAKHNFPLLIVTKSNLVTRDIDIFRQTKTVVSISVTTLRADIAGLIEPHAPSPNLRISALKRIGEEGIPTVARVDPIIPTINDDERDFEELVSALADVDVKQVTVSTLKPVRGFFSALRSVDPGLHGKLWDIYKDGYWAMGYRHMREARSKEIIEKLRPVVIRYGLRFASCREGLPMLNTSLCDGTAHCRGPLSTSIPSANNTSSLSRR